VAAAELAGATCFVCGTDGFVSAASGLLIEAGADRSMIRTERFGPTGSDYAIARPHEVAA
jgi:ferredoxin-NADP reductase